MLILQKKQERLRNDNYFKKVDSISFCLWRNTTCISVAIEEIQWSANLTYSKDKIFVSTLVYLMHRS